jgi:hypothetical protein
MSLHINRFVDAIKAVEARGGRDLTMSLRDAKDLHSDITKLLLSLERMREALVRPQSTGQQDVTVVEWSGGNFKNS